jgi:ParB family transcriptional regulator, chromosome partitioning protein
MQSEQPKVPFDRLIRDDAANVRKKHSREAIVEMKASILAHDIIQPIAVRPPVTGDADLGGQLYRIFAGGRRWIALGELVQEGKLPSDHPVPITIRDTDDATATELSLAENLIREQMLGSVLELSC